ncbi:MAG: alginate lyase family protein [Bacteroidetes bacterium]|nr:alginate lyase family protein [Bacteroidota bacterium]
MSPKKLLWYLETSLKLGVTDVLYVTKYKFLLKKGLLKKKFPQKAVTFDKFFYKPIAKVENYPVDWKIKLFKEADGLIEGNLKYYSFHSKKLGNPPNWFLNPFNNKEFPEHNKHWTELPDFNNNIGDIKNIWEASKFDWISVLSRAYAVSGDEKYLDTLNNWIFDWTEKNKYNSGPNWKCGQETSFKLFNLLLAAVIFKQDKTPADSLIKLIELFLYRIDANIRYATSQRNNHGTSEAAALYIGGNWLASVSGEKKSEYLKIANKGKSLLEGLAAQLIYNDGSFSQHSVTYHRVLLDTLSYVEFWREKLKLNEFSIEFKTKALKAGEWMASMIDESGDCPNLGSNDGAMVLNIHSCDYRDFRPGLQTNQALYKNEYCFEDGAYDEPIYWLGINKSELKKVTLTKESKVFQGGYVIMKGKQSWAALRFPFFRFRPNQNDIFHFDLWYKGKNILIDSGSYSYNPGKDFKGPDLKSVHAHNTASFDGAEQMPRISKFLLAKWIKPGTVGEIKTEDKYSGNWGGSYTDYRGNSHGRKVEWNDNDWTITDKLSGNAKSVKLGFNFYPDDFKIDKNIINFSWGKIEVSQNASVEIVDHQVSLYYWNFQPAKRILISSANNSIIITKISLN